MPFVDQRLEAPTWFLTFSTYGSWLPGDRRGSIDASHNAPGTPLRPGNHKLAKKMRSLLVQPPFQIGEVERGMVQEAIVEVCRFRGWVLHALHVRTSHLHAVVTGQAEGERIANDFKGYATRRLRREGRVAPDRRVWSQGSWVRSVGTCQAFERACRYVIEKQGTPLPGPQPVSPPAVE